jgi:hypothetical protein
MPNCCEYEVDPYVGRFKMKHEGDKLSPLSTLQDCKVGKRLPTNFADFPPKWVYQVYYYLRRCLPWLFR